MKRGKWEQKEWIQHFCEEGVVHTQKIYKADF